MVSVAKRRNKDMHMKALSQIRNTGKRGLRRRKNRGMTLIEIIVVITIIALVTAAVSVAVIPQLEQAKRDRAKQDIATIMSGLKVYYAKKGNYPDTGAGLK